MKKNVLLLVLICIYLLITSIAAYAHADIELDFYEVFENHGSVMIISDSQTGEILHANKAASSFYGYKTEELESMKIQDLNTLTPDETKKKMQEIIEEKRHEFILDHRLANGDIRTVEIKSYPYTSGNKTLLIGIVTDVTKKTQLEEKKRMLTNALWGMVALLLAVSFLVIWNSRKLKAQNNEINIIKENLRLLLDSTAEAIYGIDTDGNCTFCNASSLKLLGYSHEDELLGKNMHWQIHYKRADGKNLPVEECQIFKALTKGEGAHVEDEVLWRADGTCFPAGYHSYPQYRNGKIIGAVVTFTDITERKLAQDEIIRANKQLEDSNKQLQEKQYLLEEQNAVIEELNSQLEDENERYQQQKEILQAIIDSLGAGIVMVDLEGQITFINEAWRDIFYYLDFNKSYNLNDSFYINDNACCNTELFLQGVVNDIENKDEVLTNLINLIRDRDSRYVVDMEQASPVKRFLNLYSHPCVSYSGQIFGRVFVVRDVSHQKEVDRLKMELISTVSHELRTPMSSILGFSELLLTRKLSEDRHREFTEIINSEARRLTDLINDFLDIQRMESGKQVFHMQFNSLDQIVEEAVKLFENAGDKYDIIFNKAAGCKLEIYCDKYKMLQVITNILSNAIKYSPNGGEIIIDLAEVNSRVRVSITDHGLGIPENVKNEIFTKFYRVDDEERRKIGGTGLGLAICKEIVKAHGGEIGFNSIYGQGSTFYFDLPYSESSIADEAVKKKNCNTSCVKGDLLIVEDDAFMVRLIKEILKAEDMGIHDVSSGEEALKLVTEHCYKLIILDIALSGQMNGWDVLKELKNNKATAGTPIVISSVYENKNIDSQNEVMEYLVKPFEPDQLIRVVRRALNGNLDSKMMINGESSLAKGISDILNSKGIGVKHIEQSGNLLIITLEGEDGLENE